jgi:hypothetical protein
VSGWDDLTTTDAALELYDPLNGATSGTVTGTTDYEAGLFGRDSFVFDGATRIDYAALPAFASGGSNEVTIFLRCKLSAVDSTLSTLLGVAGVSAISVYPLPSSYLGVFNSNGTVSNFGGPFGGAGGGLADGEWHSVAITGTTGPSTNDDYYVVYIDGVASLTAAAGSYGPYFNTASPTIRLGRWSNLADGRDLTGSLQDLAIYSRALDATEIAALDAGPTTAHRGSRLASQRLQSPRVRIIA